jgi:hypothetical protein
MRVQLIEVNEARSALSRAFIKLQVVCDHRNEVGSKNYYYSTERDCCVCRYCEEEV